VSESLDRRKANAAIQRISDVVEKVRETSEKEVLRLIISTSNILGLRGVDGTQSLAELSDNQRSAILNEWKETMRSEELKKLQETIQENNWHSIKGYSTLDDAKAANLSNPKAK
jgi:hypothetical protein